MRRLSWRLCWLGWTAFTFRTEQLMSSHAKQKSVVKKVSVSYGTHTSVLDVLRELASDAVGMTESYVDPRLGTWNDNPVGGAAERDGTWLAFEARQRIAEVLRCVWADPEIAKRMASKHSAYLHSDGCRYEVRLIALSRGSEVRDTQPCGTVSLSLVICGRVRSSPLVRDARHRGDSRVANWVERTTSARIRERGSGVTTLLGGPPRALEGVSNIAALVLEVILRPPKDECVRVDGPQLERRPLGPELATFFVEADREQDDYEGDELARRARRLVTGVALRDLRVGGLDDEMRALARRLLWSRCLDQAELEALGVSHVKGALLYGPPGTGKTTAARELANALGANDDRLVVVNGPELLDKFVGNSERLVRDLFQKAKREWTQAQFKGTRPPLRVVVFDEIDALCRHRGSLTGDTTGVRDSITAQLLACLDGVEDAGNILVIGTTNRPDLLDPALLRPGRLEVSLRIDPPATPEARRAVLLVHVKPLFDKLSDDAFTFLFGTPHFLSTATSGFSGADLAGLVSSALSSAVERAALRTGAVDIIIDRCDFELALLDFAVSVGDVTAHAHDARQAAGWPLMADLENKWRESHEGNTRPLSPAHVRHFLQELAYSKREIRLPLNPAEFDYMAYHLYYYICAEPPPLEDGRSL